MGRRWMRSEMRCRVSRGFGAAFKVRAFSFSQWEKGEGGEKKADPDTDVRMLN